MRIHNLTVHFHQPQPALTPLSASVVGADARTFADMALGEVPDIGDPWPGVKGIYAGVSRGIDDAPDSHLVLLVDKPDELLAWQPAMDWAAGLGEGAHLPTRDESALLYAHLRGEFEPGRYYWTGTQCSDANAWLQHFANGDQSDNDKSFKAHARAVRRFPA